jgi:hypothetical protein
MRTFFCVVIATCFLGACSSVPEFRPSVPVEEAASFNNALDICASYQIEGTKNSSGTQALPARVSVLTPWLNCYETIFRRFPEAKSKQDFVAFFRALKEVHDVMNPPDAEFIDWQEMNSVIKMITNHLHNQYAYTVAESEAIKQELPSFAFYLATTGQYVGSENDTAGLLSRVKDEQIRALIRDTQNSPGDLQGGTSNRSKQGAQQNSPQRGPLSREQKNYCKKFRLFKNQVGGLEELALYQKALEDQNIGSGIQYVKLSARIDKMKKETLSSQKNLETELATLQLASPGFRNDFCLQAGIHYEKRK